jgi:hypothetical protein
MPERTEQINIRLTPEQVASLDRQADRTGRNRSELARELIAGGLDMCSFCGQSQTHGGHAGLKEMLRQTEAMRQQGLNRIGAALALLEPFIDEDACGGESEFCGIEQHDAKRIRAALTKPTPTPEETE